MNRQFHKIEAIGVCTASAINPQEIFTSRLKIYIAPLWRLQSKTKRFYTPIPIAVKVYRDEEININEIILNTKIGSVDLIPANIDLSKAEIELMNMLDRERILKHILSPLKNIYDYILIDCPQSLGILTINALTASDEVIVPVETDYLALREAEILINQTVKKVKRKLNKKLTVKGILPTMHNLKTIHTREVPSSLKKYFKDMVFNTVIKETVKFKDSSVGGCSILQYVRDSDAAEAYRSLSQEVMAGE